MLAVLQGAGRWWYGLQHLPSQAFCSTHEGNWSSPFRFIGDTLQLVCMPGACTDWLTACYSMELAIRAFGSWEIERFRRPTFDALAFVETTNSWNAPLGKFSFLRFVLPFTKATKQQQKYQLSQVGLSRLRGHIAHKSTWCIGSCDTVSDRETRRTLMMSFCRRHLWVTLKPWSDSSSPSTI